MNRKWFVNLIICHWRQGIYFANASLFVFVGIYSNLCICMIAKQKGVMIRSTINIVPVTKNDKHCWWIETYMWPNKMTFRNLIFSVTVTEKWKCALFLIQFFLVYLRIFNLNLFVIRLVISILEWIIEEILDHIFFRHQRNHWNRWDANGWTVITLMKLLWDCVLPA